MTVPPVRPHRVLMVGAFPFPAPLGSQVYAGGMAEALAAAGDRVRLCAYGHGEGAWPAGVHPRRGPRLPSAATVSGPTWDRPAQDLLLTGVVARALREEPVDVVHAHHVEGALAAWTAMRLARVRRPLVYDCHTLLGEELPQWWSRGAAHRLAGPLGRAADRAVVRVADACVAISEAGAAGLRAAGAGAVWVCPPGVDVDAVRGGDAARARARWALGDGPWVVYAGNLDPYQDLDLLWPAAARVPEVGLLVLTHADPAAAQRAAADAGIAADRARFVQQRDLGDLRDALAVAAIAALPRRRCSGFPMKLLNFLAAGVPVVCARETAPPVEGVLPVPVDDPQAFADALRGALASPEMLTRLGEAGRRAVDASWAWSARIRDVRRMHETLVTNGRGHALGTPAACGGPTA